MDRMSCKFSYRGLTLIELMITLVILGVSVTVAAPAMQQLIHGNRLRTETSRLLDAINLARSEAVLRNIPVSLCPSTMADSGRALCAGEFADGWIVFTNRNRDRVIDAGAKPGDPCNPFAPGERQERRYQEQRRTRCEEPSARVAASRTVHQRSSSARSLAGRASLSAGEKPSMFA